MTQPNPFTTPISDDTDEQPKMVYGRPPGAPDESAPWRMLFVILSWVPASVLLIVWLVFAISSLFAGGLLSPFFNDPKFHSLLVAALCFGVIGIGISVHRTWLSLLGLGGALLAGYVFSSEYAF